MRKCGKWVLTLSLLAATPGLTFAASSKSKDAKPATGTRASRTDNQRVAEDVANALRGKVQGDISIEYKDGVAVLSGSVLDPKTKDKASSLVEKVSGVSKVDNRLTVIERKRAITERLRGDGMQGGVVQAGHAGETSKRRVQQVNAEVPEVEVPAPVRTASTEGVMQGNQETAEQIGAVLSSAQLDGYDIQIRFQNGVAMLDGSVGTQAERAAATRAVSGVPGVRSVANRLRCTEEPAAQMANAGGRGPYSPPPGAVRGAGYMQPGAGPGPGQGQGMQGPPPPGMGYPGGYPGGQMNGMPMGPGAPPYPPSYGQQGAGASQAVYNSPNMPDHSWPTYAQYPNSAAVSYPTQYSASAWPYIGPFYPYPQVPLGWRDATLRWDDGQWNLMFKPRTDRWWWFLNPNNW
jgi:osmotically-inducible protein OsmY